LSTNARCSQHGQLAGRALHLVDQMAPGFTGPLALAPVIEREPATEEGRVTRFSERVDNIHRPTCRN
jgi:hypothetical protein